MWWERHCWTVTPGRRGANKEEDVDASATPSLIALAAVAASVVGLRLSRAFDVGNRGRRERWSSCNLLVSCNLPPTFHAA